MAINVGNKANMVAVKDANENTGVINLAKVEETRQQFSLEEAKKNYEAEIIESGIIDQLTSQIDISNTNTILEFGKEPADEMAKISDKVLSKYNGATIDDTSKLVNALLEVMNKIDVKEIQSLEQLKANTKKGFFDKFKETVQQKLEKLLNKYKTIGGQMEQICTQLNVYEQQIKSSNEDIATMYEAAKVEYKQLVATIMAAEQACKEIEEYKQQKEQEFAETGNQELSFEIQNVSQALVLMEQRTADLRGAEAVALQSIPIFKIQEYTNANLARKVNSAMIVTVPAFKTALVNSIIAKQQSIQAQGLQALDEATAALIRRNAENSVKQLAMSQKLANTSAVKADDIEYSWNTIMNGIKQYKEMENQYREIRKEEAKRIETANARYIAELHNGNMM